MAGLSLRVQSLQDDPLSRLCGFAVFGASARADAAVDLLYDATSTLASLQSKYADVLEQEPIYEVLTDELGAMAFFRAGEGKFLFRMFPPSGETLLEEISEGRALSNWDEVGDLSVLRFSLWIAFALTAAHHNALLIHSSAVEYRGKAVLCLGESGTGKSTHTRLWCENLEGARLLNDDCPIVLVKGGGVFACGSAWSGKTPCFRDVRLPVAAFVRIVRAPFNRITELGRLEAFGALYPSCPPEFKFDNALVDAICGILSSIMAVVPVYRLECLPDAAAALLSSSTIFSE